MKPEMAILVIPAFLVLVGLIVHSRKYRGKRDTLFFFITAALFGIARGNILWWITAVHFQGKFPYIFQHRFLGVFHDSLIADAGWIVTTYIGLFLAQRIVERIPAVCDRVFPLVSLTCLFIVCLSYAVESTAITMGWWQWTISTKSKVLRDVPLAGIEGWCSVGLDFLLPYLLIRHVRRPGVRWPYLSLLIFPVHMCAHLFPSRVGALLPITPFDIYYWIMFLAILVLPFVSDLRLARPFFPDRAFGRDRTGAPIPGGGFGRSLPVLGLAVVVAVLLVCDLGIHHNLSLLMAKIPLGLYALLAVPALPPWVVLAIAAVLPVFLGVFLVPPILIPSFFFALQGRALWARRPWLRWAYLAVPIVLTVWFYTWSRDRNELDRRYWGLINQANAEAARNPQAAQEHLTEASRLKPYSLPAYNAMVLLDFQTKNYDEAERILKKMLELRPISEEITANFGNLYLLRGNYDEAERWFRKALEINPQHVYSREMLQNLPRLRQGEKLGGSILSP
jgi:tetratricopeptide repeat protein